ncbi:MAG: hypothetical protein GWN53_00365, partial [Gammaproteobacteria bacterium]|nr:hypothetical protein [Gammaproteobacteria bacterium]
ELMLFSMRYLWDDGAGVFVDRVVAPDDIGLLRHTINPFELNCRAARLLGRLSQEAGRSDFGERARVALSSQTAVARSHSVDAAWYALALRDVGFSETS